MKCTYCGYENKATDSFCSNCGNKLQEATNNEQVNFNQTTSQANSNAQMDSNSQQQAGGYGNPTNGYGQQQTGGYGNPMNGYGQQQTGGYGNPMNGYGQQQTGGYGNPMNGYGQQQTGGYGNPMNGYGQQAAQNQQFGKMSEKDFYQRFASKHTKGWVIIVSFLCFASAVIGFAQMAGNARELGFAMRFSNLITLLVLLSVIEIIFKIIIGILLLVNQKWIFTLILAIGDVIIRMLILILFEEFSFAGIILLAFAVIGTIYLKKVNNAYKIYQNTGNMPQRPI